MATMETCIHISAGWKVIVMNDDGAASTNTEREHFLELPKFWLLFSISGWVSPTGVHFKILRIQADRLLPNCSALSRETIPENPLYLLSIKWST